MLNDPARSISRGQTCANRNPAPTDLARPMCLECLWTIWLSVVFCFLTTLNHFFFLTNQKPFVVITKNMKLSVISTKLKLRATTTYRPVSEVVCRAWVMRVAQVHHSKIEKILYCISR